MKKCVTILIAGLLFFNLAGCSKDDNPNGPSGDGDSPDTTSQSQLKTDTVTIDRSATHQTIDGFGFFGAYDVWWGNDMWNDDWGDMVISDLGITIWRNEYAPPSTPDASQDADWSKMEPVVKSLKTIADQYGVDLKFIFSVWSPPADLKWQSSFSWAGDKEATRGPGPVTTKNGGTLNPNKYAGYAAWINEGIMLYKDDGIDLYALSLQNEPMFVEPYNSCTYTEAWYNQMLKSVVPLIRQEHPGVKIFGSENMLEMEGKDNNWPYFYHSALNADDSASADIDILAVHGYSDGVNASSGSELTKMWTNHKEQFSMPMNKPAWMTETSGYADSWENSGNTPGALSLAMDIYTGLKYGNMSAWVWWQGSQLDGIGLYNLMNGTTAGKKYYVSKQYYRFIRPGAVRIEAISGDPELLVTAFVHETNNTTTVIIINSGTKDKNVIISGEGIPDTFSSFMTNPASNNCTQLDDVTSGTAAGFTIPARTIVTLQAGGMPF